MASRPGPYWRAPASRIRTQRLCVLPSRGPLVMRAAVARHRWQAGQAPSRLTWKPGFGAVLTAQDITGASGSATFTWTIQPDTVTVTSPGP
jgi:hypothetical protein